MIYKVKVNNEDKKKAVCPWWHDVTWLKDKEEIEFTPGINVIFGPNGSGKSTVIDTIAKLLCCFDGNKQIVGEYTWSSIHQSISESGGSGRHLKLGVEPIHDGSPILHHASDKKSGIVGGSFDFDFGDEGLIETLFKGSKGEKNIRRIASILKKIKDGKCEPVQWSKYGPETFPNLAKFLEGNGKKERMTILFDEPSLSMEAKFEIRIMEIVAEAAQMGIQVIMATHSLFALCIDGAHYIETEDGYIEKTKELARKHLVKII